MRNGTWAILGREHRVGSGFEHGMWVKRKTVTKRSVGCVEFVWLWGAFMSGLMRSGETLDDD